jgi:hypothetical protein
MRPLSAVRWVAGCVVVATLVVLLGGSPVRRAGAAPHAQRTGPLVVLIGGLGSDMPSAAQDPSGGAAIDEQVVRRIVTDVRGAASARGAGHGGL